MLIVSKCFTGECCRYDGGSKIDPEIAELVNAGWAIPVCPEQLGGLPTPRVPSELTASGERVLEGQARAVTKDGRDVTEEFVRGAEEALRIAKENRCMLAILKARSPSCGCGQIYDGSFTGALAPGDGVTAALFKREGIEVIPR